MEKPVYKLDVFEGPLDVLLFLITKNKLNICDIPIAELLDQYLEYLGRMREMDLDITSDFLEMASRLVQIKSAMLLPRRDDGEEDPRNDLMKELLGYQVCKSMAKALAARSEGIDRFVRDPQQPEHDDTYTRTHSSAELAQAFEAIRGRARRRQPPPVSAFRGVVGRVVVSVMARVVHIMKRLKRGGPQKLGELYADSRGRSEIVATFLAVLELVKSHRIRVDGAQGGETVDIVRGER